MNSELTREWRKWHNIIVYETGRPPRRHRLRAPRTLADRMTRCGYPGCRCRADPPRPACTAPTTSGPARKTARPPPGSCLMTSSTTTVPGSTTTAACASSSPNSSPQPRHRRRRRPLEPLAIPGRGTAQPAAEPEHRPPDSVGSARLTCGQPASQPRSPRSALNVKASQVDDLIRKDSNGSWMPVGTNGCPQGTGSPASAIPARRCRQLRGCPRQPVRPRAPLVTRGTGAGEARPPSSRARRTWPHLVLDR